MNKSEYQILKGQQLGMPMGTARSRLVQIILYELASKCGKTMCYRCGKPIHDYKEMSIDHIQEWMYSADPISLFFDYANIALSHRGCNSAITRCRAILNSKLNLKGVAEDRSKKRKKKYKATIGKDGKTINLGYFVTPTEAAMAYDTKAIELFGNRAVTNKSLGLI